MQDKFSNILIRKLEEIGLGSREARLYLCALQLGPTSVQKLAASSMLNRTSIYPVLESLQKAGLLTVSVRGLKKVFVAEPPARLEGLLEAKRSTMRSILPDLEALRQLPVGAESIKHYIGKPAVRSAYAELLAGTKPGDEYFVCSELIKWQAVDPGFFAEFRKKRERMLLDIKILAVETAFARELKQASKGRAELRFLPKGSALDTNIVVVPQQVLIQQLSSPPTAVVLRNESIVKLHQQLLRIIWNAFPVLR